MRTQITADAATLVNQAPMTAKGYMHAGIEAIDGAFGDGYAKEHPELLAAFMLASSHDLHGSVVAQTLQDGLAEISSALSK